MHYSVTGIFGPPRSGTSWLGQLFNSAPEVAYRFQPLFSFAFKDRLSPHSSKEEILQFFDDILKTEDEFVLQTRNVSGNKNQTFQKTIPPRHLVFKEVRYHHLMERILTETPQVKLVGIIRNPCATILSWLNTPKEFNPEWNRLNEWRYARLKNADKPEEFNGFEKWKEIAQMYLLFEKQFPAQFKLITYEDLHNDTVEEVKKLFEFCNIGLSEQTLNFIQLSKSVNDDDPYAVLKKGKDINSWQNNLEEEIKNAILSELKGTNLERFLK